jgi:nucleotide-binding universal stress UspA family protein
MDMIKSILLVLDKSDTSIAAKRYAIDLAKKKHCKLVGVGIVDTPWITAAQPEPLGGGAYKIFRDEEVIKQTHEKVKSLLKTFEDSSKKAGIEHQVIELEGFPATEIENLSEENDLIVIGKTTDFHFEMEDDSNLTVRHLTRDNPRPIIIVTSDDSTVCGDQTVLIAYDGSLQSARALHMFLLLGLAEGKKLHIVTHDKDKKSANQIVGRAHNMCTKYGYAVTSMGLSADKSIEDILKAEIKKLNPCLLVMGAHSHTGLKELIFGSTTEHMMKQSNVPLFVHH